MTTENSIPARQRSPWNRGRLIGQKRPLKPKDVWTIRVRLQMEGRRRDLAMFNLAIDSKLRGCDLVRFGLTATTPMLWIYSENDRYFTPALATSLYQAFTRNGGKAEFEEVGPYDNDGHRFFSGGAAQVWGPLVAGHLDRQPKE